MIVAGGRLFLEELSRRDIFPETLLLPAGAEVPEWAERAQCEVIPVTKAVSDSIDPGGDGYIGNFKMPTPPLVEELIGNKRRLERVLVLDNVTDPGNLGTLLRTAAGFAYDAVILTNHCADLYHHAVVRAARGVHFMENMRLYVLREEDGDDTYAMINHIITRNDLDAVAYTPMPFEESANRLADATAYTKGPPGTLLPKSLFGTKPSSSSPSPSPAAQQQQKAPKVFEVTGEALRQMQLEGLPPAAAAQYSNASSGPRLFNPAELPLPPATTPTTSGSSSTSPQPMAAAAAASNTPVVAPGHLPPPAKNAAVAKRLFSFMVDNFVSTAAPKNGGGEGSSSSATPPRHFRDKGFVVFAGPDTKSNLVRRLEQRVTRPTTVLQLDDNAADEDGDESEGRSELVASSPASNGDLMTGLPAVMYALRPNGHWDYLLPSERHDPNVTHVDSGRVQIGPDYGSVQPFAYTAEEQEAMADNDNWWKKNRRQIRRQRTDEGYWLEAENNRAHFKGMRDDAHSRNPTARYTGEGAAAERAFAAKMEKRGKLSDTVPDITSDYHEQYDREFLRHERAAAEAMEANRPSVYDHRMWYENADGQQWQ